MLLIIKFLGAALLTAAFLAATPGLALAADPEEIRASECRPSGDEFQIDWNAACAEQLGD